MFAFLLLLKILMSVTPTDPAGVKVGACFLINNFFNKKFQTNVIFSVTLPGFLVCCGMLKINVMWAISVWFVLWSISW